VWCRSANSSRIRLTWPVRWSPGHTDFPYQKSWLCFLLSVDLLKTIVKVTSVVAWPVVSEDRMNAKFLATGICTFPSALQFASTSLTDRNEIHLLNTFSVEEVTRCWHLNAFNTSGTIAVLCCSCCLWILSPKFKRGHRCRFFFLRNGLFRSWTVSLASLAVSYCISSVIYLNYCSLFHPTRLAVGPAQPPLQWVPDVFDGAGWGLKRPGRGVDYPPPFSAEVKGNVELCHYFPSGPPRLVIRWKL
jgi:hypothetical protein